MQQMAMGTMTGFTGVLVQRHYKPGQNYVQLVFQTAEGLRLSLSRNIRMVRGLIVGQAYHIKGRQMSVGNKTYVHEPVAVAVRAPANIFKRHVRLFIAAAIVIPLVGLSGVLAFSHRYAAGNNRIETPSVSTNAHQAADTATTPGESLSPTAETPATTPAVAETPVSSTKKTRSNVPAAASPVTKPIVTPQSQPESAPVVTEQPAPVVDPAPLVGDTPVVDPVVDPPVTVPPTVPALTDN